MIHVSDYSDEEIGDIWFCQADFVNMKKAFARTVKLVSQGVYQGDDEDQCARGLEYRGRSGALARRENKANGLDAVLDEQDRQYSLGIVDDELIRKAFVNSNIHCRLASLKMGIKDHEEAFLIHEDGDAQLFDDELDEDSAFSDEEMDYCDISLVRKSAAVSSQTQRLHHL
jgi:hypothetical protein